MSATKAARPVKRPVKPYRLDTSLSHLTAAERAVRGKAARAEVPLESHETFDPPADRPDPIALLEEQGRSRVPELVPVRYGRMMVSPFTYFRGAALPMASDLAGTPVSGLAVQACGDAHLSNFGIFGSAERRLVFDVNDFDETLPGPWEWDVKRLAASLEVAARDNGFGGKKRRAIVTGAVSAYRQYMRLFAEMGNLAVWYAIGDVEQLREQVTSQLKARGPQELRQGPDQGADPGQHAGSGQAHAAGGRAAEDHLRAAAARPDRPADPRGDGPQGLRDDAFAWPARLLVQLYCSHRAARCSTTTSARTPTPPGSGPAAPPPARCSPGCAARASPPSPPMRSATTCGPPDRSRRSTRRSGSRWRTTGHRRT